MRRASAALMVALLLGGCGGAVPVADATLPEPAASAATAGIVPSTTAPPPAGLPVCVDRGFLAAPDAWYDDEIVYVGNEMPVDAVRSFAERLDGYQDIWIDRDHHGWVAVGFNGVDVEAVQALLEAEFPGVGVVAVDVPYTNQELRRIARRVQEQLPEGMYAQQGWAGSPYTEVWIGLLTAENVALVGSFVDDDTVCLTGEDPASLPAPGPQPPGGDGWTYLAVADAPLGEWPVVIAQAEALGEAWATLALAGGPPEVDFAAEIVIGFGVHYSGSCPDTRFDDVVVDGAEVAPVVAHTTVAQGCTDDANPRTYLVAVDRDLLPPPPFRVRPGWSGHETPVLEVTADLRLPGSIPAPGDLTQAHALPPRVATGTPYVVEPGYPGTFVLDPSCGTGYLGVVNGVGWTTDDAFPPEWEAAVVDGLLDLEIDITEGPEPTLTATAAGRSVEYLPGPDQGDPCG